MLIGDADLTPDTSGAQSRIDPDSVPDSAKARLGQREHCVHEPLTQPPPKGERSMCEDHERHGEFVKKCWCRLVMSDSLS